MVTHFNLKFDLHLNELKIFKNTVWQLLMFSF